MRLLSLLLSFVLAVVVVASPQRSAEIAERFTKTKYKNKQKRGVEVSRYRDVQSRVDVRAPQQYTGRYDGELPNTSITIEVGADGTVTGRGSDPHPFTLRNGRVRDALLTAAKVYEDGTTEPLEGAFLTMRVREGTTPDKITSDKTQFGLGVVNVDYQISGGIHLDKLFFHRVP
jgi:hypothetical protein